MITATLNWASAGAALADHLWQSTLCIGLAWLLTVMLRKNGPGVRHAIWMCATLKFLVPLSLLTTIGGTLAPAARPAAISEPHSTLLQTIVPVTQPVATKLESTSIRREPSFV